MPDDCLICDRIALIRKNANKYFVAEMETGFIVLGDHQLFRGYSLFLSKEHKQELHQLEPDFRKLFLWEMSEVARAVFNAFKPRKMNYELLGNTDHHMHWHLFPRHENDPLPNRTVWNIPKETRNDPINIPSDTELDEMRRTLLETLKTEKVPVISGPSR
jgi:diadenosine tetraphosphate (Ap4A) HIT family hydrolase